MNTRTSRRKFLQAAAAAVAAPTVITSSALGADGRPPASERIVMGTIGCGGQGTGDMGGFLGFRQVQMVAVCDVVPDHRENAKHDVNKRYNNKDCKTYNDFREVLARDDIDAVLIGTPDHWHAIITIEACKHGKDVYCEKPECLTIREGRAMVDGRAALRPRVLRRQPARAGRLRRLAAAALGRRHRPDQGGVRRRAAARRATATCPSSRCRQGVDWDMWLGPAPWRPFHDSLIHGGFRGYRDYSGGGMTDWGAHRFGAAMFAAGVHETGPGRDHPARRQGRQAADLPLRQRPADVSRRHRQHQLPRAPRASSPGKHRTPVGRVDMPGYEGHGGIFGDFLALRADPRSGPSATSRSPTAPRPSATWATSPTGSSGRCSGTRSRKRSSATPRPPAGSTGRSEPPGRFRESPLPLGEG